MAEFRPLVRNPHLLTIAGNYAVRRLDEQRYPVDERYVQTEPGVQVLVHTQRPSAPARGAIVTVHGLEGSSAAGYLRSLAQLALESGYSVHRTNMRSCGGTEHMCSTMYHAGLTSDTLHIVKQLRGGPERVPVYLVGFSLGGNVVLKLAGELGDNARNLIAGVCAVSTPIDLGACVRRMSERQNRLYEWRFLTRLKDRIRKRAQSEPGVYDLGVVNSVESVYEFDDKITAPHFGFGTADNYYATQSSKLFLDRIRVPALLVQAKDDPLIPFDIFDTPAIRNNPDIRLRAVDHGGHLGFVANSAPRFWLDREILAWIAELEQR